MAVLNDCCGAHSLKAGTIIIAGLYVIFSLMQTATATGVFINYWDLDDVKMRESGSFTQSELKAVSVSGLIQIMFGILLLFGAMQEKAVILIPWMVEESLVAIAAAVVVITKIIEPDTVIILMFIMYTYLSVYCRLVVYSYYQTLRENARKNKEAESVNQKCVVRQI